MNRYYLLNAIPKSIGLGGDNLVTKKTSWGGDKKGIKKAPVNYIRRSQSSFVSLFQVRTGMPIVDLKMLAEVSWNDIFVFISKFSDFPDSKKIA